MSKKRTITTYRSYMWRDKDPVIDALRTAVSDSKKSYTEIRNTSDVSVATLRGWFSGKTRRPQFTTVAAVASALGKHTIRIRNGKATLSD